MSRNVDHWTAGLIKEDYSVSDEFKLKSLKEGAATRVCPPRLFPGLLETDSFFRQETATLSLRLSQVCKASLLCHPHPTDGLTDLFYAESGGVYLDNCQIQSNVEAYAVNPVSIFSDRDGKACVFKLSVLAAGERRAYVAGLGETRSKGVGVNFMALDDLARLIRSTCLPYARLQDQESLVGRSSLCAKKVVTRICPALFFCHSFFFDHTHKATPPKPEEICTSVGSSALL